MNDDGDFLDALRLVPRLKLDTHADFAQAAGVTLPIAAINLPHRADRWRAVTRRMTAVGLDKLVHVPAVDGAQLDLQALQPLLAQPASLIETAPRSHETMTRPAVGCFLSHLAVWRWLLETGLERILILEDDATPAPGFDAARLQSVVSARATASDLVLLGRIIMNGMAEEADERALARIYYFNGTFAYLITPAACRALMPELLPMDGHIDHPISRALIARRNPFAAPSAEPPLFEPDWSLRSDCYVPLVGEAAADQELGALLTRKRRLLLDEGRPLIPPMG